MNDLRFEIDQCSEKSKVIFEAKAHAVSILPRGNKVYSPSYQSLRDARLLAIKSVSISSDQLCLVISSEVGWRRSWLRGLGMTSGGIGQR